MFQYASPIDSGLALHRTRIQQVNGGRGFFFIVDIMVRCHGEVDKNAKDSTIRSNLLQNLKGVPLNGGRATKMDSYGDN